MKKLPTRSSSRATTAASSAASASTANAAANGAATAASGEAAAATTGGGNTRSTRRLSRSRTRASNPTNAPSPPPSENAGSKRKRASPRVTRGSTAGPAPTAKPLPRSRPRGRAAQMAASRAAARAAKAAAEEEASAIAASASKEENDADDNKKISELNTQEHLNDDDEQEEVSDLDSDQETARNLPTPKAKNSSDKSSNKENRVIDRVPPIDDDALSFSSSRRKESKNKNDDQDEEIDDEEEDVNSSSTYTLTATMGGKCVGVRVLFPVEDNTTATTPSKGASNANRATVVNRRKRKTPATKKSNLVIEVPDDDEKLEEENKGENADGAISITSSSHAAAAGNTLSSPSQEEDASTKGRQLPARRGRAGSTTRSTASSVGPTSTPQGTTRGTRGGSRRGGARTAGRNRPSTDPTPDPVSSSTNKETPQNNKSSFLPQHLGHDGNLFYCHICRDVGDVVCCDGCPNVFHPVCVPKGPSRTSLDNDDDPWYCPDCFVIHKKQQKGKDKETEDSMKVEEEKSEEMDIDGKNEKDAVKKGDDTKVEPIKGEVKEEEKPQAQDEESKNIKIDKGDDDKKDLKIKINVIVNNEKTTADTQATTGTSSATLPPEPSSPTPPAASPPLRRGRSRGMDGRGAAKRKCIECQKSGGNMEQCEGCGVFLHHNPSCRDDDEGMSNTEDVTATETENEDGEDSSTALSPKKKEKQKGIDRRPLCSNCTAERVVEEETDWKEESVRAAKKANAALGHENELTSPDTAILKKSKKSGGENDEFSVSELENLDDDESAALSSSKRNKGKKGKRSKRSRSSTGTSPTSYDDKRERKRSKKNYDDVLRFTKDADGEYEPKEERKKKKKKKRKTGGDSTPPRSKSPVNENGVSGSSSLPAATAATTNTPSPSSARKTPQERPVKATPALFFFLADKRLLIERALTKKNRQFRKLPSGLEKNELIAREGFMWWSKLERAEIARWIDVAMQDFECRIIEWKEEENIRLMLEASEEMERNNNASGVENEGNEDGSGPTAAAAGSGGGAGATTSEGDAEDATDEATIPTTMLKSKEYIPPEDEAYLYHRHQRLYTSTSIDSKTIPRNSGDDVANNTVLLELLKDLRFHPLPMVHPTRSRSDLDFQDFSKMTIPYFSVQGPLQTSVGDECLGCTRGWNHFCPVLKRHFPAAEHRAKLQPPVSSLVACRVGLGLKTRFKEEDGTAAASGELSPSSPNGENKSSPMKSFYLSQPSTRTDDIVQFVEETIAVKIPPPPDQVDPPGGDTEGAGKKSSSGKTLSRGALPMRGRKKREEVSAEASVTENKEDTADSSKDGSVAGRKRPYGATKMYECGGCGAMTHTNKGCVACRREKLVVEMAKRLPLMANAVSSKLRDVTDHESSTHGAGFLKVHTVMLGRAPLRDSNFDSQKEGDGAVADAMTTMPWNPNVIMPPQKKILPTPKPPVSVSPPSADSGARESLTQQQRNTFRPIQDVTPSDSDSDAVVDAGTSRIAERTGHLLAKANNVIDGVKENAGISAVERLGGRQLFPIPEGVPDSTSTSLTPRGRRQRSGRVSGLTVTKAASDLMESPDRQELAEAHKEEANELQRRCFNVAVCGVLLGLMKRDPLRMFAEPVPENVAGYRKVVARPMDFGAIRKKVLGGEYSSFGAFVNDARLVCINALCFNPPGSIYHRTAKELYDALEVMQKRASKWMTAIKSAHASFFAKQRHVQQKQRGISGAEEEESQDSSDNDPFKELRRTWPGATELLENGDWLRDELEADFFRTKENEGAYYGCLAVRRAAVAAETTLAKSLHAGGIYQPSVRRTYKDDESLRNLIDERVSKIKGPVQLRDEPNWREEPILKLLRRVRKRRVEGRTSSESGCARCDTMRLEEDAKLINTVIRRKYKRKGEVVKPRIASSRLAQSTGLASARARERVAKQMPEAESTLQQISDTAMGKAVSVRGSRIHGWGLFADHPFKKGEVIAEYVGEYISNPVADAREKYYQERRIQDYQFRVDGSLVIDATLKGGHARYINHNCNPNCIAKIIDGEPPNKHLKRVIIVSQRDIQAREEITYDYQFPLELDLDARIPCTCGSKHCRGFMNWDLPEKSSSRLATNLNRAGRVTKPRKRPGRPKKI